MSLSTNDEIVKLVKSEKLNPDIVDKFMDFLLMVEHNDDYLGYTEILGINNILIRLETTDGKFYIESKDGKKINKIKMPKITSAEKKTKSILPFILIIIAFIVILAILTIVGIGLWIIALYIGGMFLTIIIRRLKYNDNSWKQSFNYSLYSWLYFI